MMPIMRDGSRALRAAALLIGTALSASSALAQRPNFGPTLFHESGLVNIPAAWVAPLGGDVSFGISRLTFGSATYGTGLPAENYTMNISTSLWGRGEFGFSLYSADFSAGMFAKALVIDQADGIWRRGLRHWLPSVAVGVRNVGGEVGLNRLGVDAPIRVNQSPTFYGVATRSTVLKAADGVDNTRPKVQLSATAGYGTGLFKEDGGQGLAYSENSTNGVFAGASLDLAVGRYSSLSLMLEHDAWAMNAGARVEAQGFRLAVYRTDLNGNSGAAAGSAAAFSAPKFAVSFGWQAHILTLIRGNRLEQRTARAEAQQGDLERQIRTAQQRIDAIQTQLNALAALASQQRSAERAELERRLKEEQDAMQRLQELIKARDAAKKPPMDGVR